MRFLRAVPLYKFHFVYLKCKLALLPHVEFTYISYC